MTICHWYALHPIRTVRPIRLLLQGHKLVHQGQVFHRTYQCVQRTYISCWRRFHILLSRFPNLHILQDVDWHCSKDNVFGSVGDDKMLLMYKPNSLMLAQLTYTRATVGTQDHQRNPRRKFRHTTAKSYLWHLAPRQSTLLSQAVRTRCA